MKKISYSSRKYKSFLKIYSFVFSATFIGIYLSVSAASNDTTAIPSSMPRINSACAQGNLSLIAELTSKPESLESHDRFGATPLMIASFNGFDTIVSLLLSKGAQIDAIDNLGRTALMYAANRQSIKTCTLLLQNKADPNHASLSGLKPIEFIFDYDFSTKTTKRQEDCINLFLDDNTDIFSLHAETVIRAKIYFLASNYYTNKAMKERALVCLDSASKLFLIEKNLVAHLTDSLNVELSKKRANTAAVNISMAALSSALDIANFNLATTVSQKSSRIFYDYRFFSSSYRSVSPDSDPSTLSMQIGIGKLQKYAEDCEKEAIACRIKIKVTESKSRN